MKTLIYLMFGILIIFLLRLSIKKNNFIMKLIGILLIIIFISPILIPFLEAFISRHF